MRRQVLRKIDVKEGSVCGQGKNPLARITLKKAKEASMSNDTVREEGETAEEYIATLEKSVKSLCLEIESLRESKTEAPQAGEENFDAILKALPEGMRGIVVQLQKDAAQSKQDAAAALAKAVASERVAEIAVLEKACSSDFPNLVGTPAEHAELLYEVKKSVSTETYDKLRAIFKAASTAASSSVTGQIGVASVTVGGDSLESLNKMAAEVQRTDPKLTRAQAFEKAMTTPEGNKLYQQYTATARH